MLHHKLGSWLLAAGALLFAASAAFGADADVTVSSGDYAPRAGASVHWSIDTSHTLTWAGQPFIPAGGIFQPRCMASASADTVANWSADMANLSTLKAHGVTNVILAAGSAESGTVPISSIRAGTLQRVIDYLDQNGFTYGIDLNAYPPGSLQAVVVAPGIYRQPDPDPGSTAAFKSIDGLTSALYFAASTHDGSILAHGQAQTKSGADALAPVGDFGGDDTVMLLYPTRVFSDTSLEGEHCPDFWSDADQVRDDLMLYLSQIKFGPGLRLFVDPMRDDLGFDGAASAGMLPTSDAYQMQFASWLSTRYSGRLSVLERAWGITNEDLPDISTAARSIPLWYQLKGVQSLYDPQSDKLFEVNTAHSSIWEDIHQFQQDSMQSAMNGLAVAIKSGVADVPVMYRWTQASASTLNRSDTGFDGLIVDSPLHGNQLIGQAVGFAMSDVEHARRTQWLVAQVTPPGASHPIAGVARSLVGYGSEELLTSDLDLLTGLGVRGLYIDALWSNSPSATNMLDAPSEQLDWLHAASQTLTSEASTLAGQRPSILYYPANLTLAAQIEQLPCGAWWLPYVFDSKPVPLGTGLEGYTLDQNGSPANVIYSISQTTPQQVTFHLPSSKTDNPEFRNAVGAPVSFTKKKGAITLTVSQDPVVITGIADLPLPEGAMAEELAEVHRLLDLGTKAGAPTVAYEQDLFHIQNDPMLELGAASAFDYNELTMLATGLKLFVSPFIWLEAEDAISQSFGSVIASPGASGGAYLWLDRSESAPVGSHYQATYKFRANAPGDYDIWASLAPTGSSAAGGLSGAPLSITIDDGAVLTADSVSSDGGSYGSLARSGSPVVGQFAWYRLTTVHLSSGDHTLTLSVTGVSKQTGRWTLGVDALCLSRGDFRPNGTTKPSF